MYTQWSEVLPAAIESLNPLHRDLVAYIMTLPGKRQPTYKHAFEAWHLSRDEFDQEFAAALGEIRLYLRRLGIGSSSDLEIR